MSYIMLSNIFILQVPQFCKWTFSLNKEFIADVSRCSWSDPKILVSVDEVLFFVHYSPFVCEVGETILIRNSMKVRNCSEQSLFYFAQLFITSGFGIIYCRNQFRNISFIVGMNWIFSMKNRELFNDPPPHCVCQPPN